MPTPRLIIYKDEFIAVTLVGDRVPVKGKYINHDQTFIGIESHGKLLAIPLAMVERVEGVKPRTVRDS